ncbi:hypothetical protein TNCV_1650081 [Trichonephila clavipes]|nr:hypothetical protein TNCV_1650081 [Trichonephila clavipes]
MVSSITIGLNRTGHAKVYSQMRVGSVCHRIVDANRSGAKEGTAYRPKISRKSDRYPTCSIMVWAGIRSMVARTYMWLRMGL